jgi:hypothetical protein
MTYQTLAPEEQRRRGRALYDAFYDWSGQQIAAGIDGSVPPGRKQGSDYNQHVPEMEASGEAMDEFAAEAGRIMGGL